MHRFPDPLLRADCDWSGNGGQCNPRSTRLPRRDIRIKCVQAPLPHPLLLAVGEVRAAASRSTKPGRGGLGAVIAQWGNWKAVTPVVVPGAFPTHSRDRCCKNHHLTGSLTPSHSKGG